MNINELRDEVHKNAVANGWWEQERSFGEIIALCHSELSESLKEYSKGVDIKKIIYVCPKCREGNEVFDYCINPDCSNDSMLKPKGIAVELADCIIRILDYCGYVGIDIEEVISIKKHYNKTRLYKQG